MSATGSIATDETDAVTGLKSPAQTDVTASEVATETGDSPVTLTPAAAQKVKEILASEAQGDEAETLKLRVAVQPGGCSGLSYDLAFDEDEIPGDQTYQVAGIPVVVDSMSAPYLQGVKIDYLETLQKSGFTIDNPNASGGCACGDSFSCG